MSFQPYHSDHSIAEVVFEIILDRIITVSDVSALKAIHASEWISELPGVKQPPGPITMRPGGVSNRLTISAQFSGDENLQPGQIEFASYKRDGATEWRMLIQGNTISLNCAAYTRWEKVWARARGYLLGALRTLAPRGGNVLAFALQYVDIFFWDGPYDEYDARQLIAPERVPSVVFGRGPQWHAHSGWFSDTAAKQSAAKTFPLPRGRLLERMNIDAVLREGLIGISPGDALQPVIKLDGFCRLDVVSPESFPSVATEPNALDTRFQFLHQASKELVVHYLTTAAAERVGLHG